MSGADGSRAIEPIESDACVSVSGVQLWPPSVVFHTPPSAAPAYTTSGFRGSTARAEMRPENFDPLLSTKTEGPIGFQDVELTALTAAGDIAPLAAAAPRRFSSPRILSRSRNALARRPLGTRPGSTPRSRANHSARFCAVSGASPSGSLCWP